MGEPDWHRGEVTGYPTGASGLTDSAGFLLKLALEDVPQAEASSKRCSEEPRWAVVKESLSQHAGTMWSSLALVTQEEAGTQKAPSLAQGPQRVARRTLEASTATPDPPGYPGLESGEGGEGANFSFLPHRWPLPPSDPKAWDTVDNCLWRGGGGRPEVPSVGVFLRPRGDRALTGCGSQFVSPLIPHQQGPSGTGGPRGAEELGTQTRGPGAAGVGAGMPTSGAPEIPVAVGGAACRVPLGPREGDGGTSLPGLTVLPAQASRLPQ